MTAFDTMIDDLYADPNMGIDVLYTPAGGLARSVRALQSAPDIAIGVFDTKAKGSALHLEFRISEAPEMKQGDSVSILGGSMAGGYRIATSDADDSRLYWKTALRVAT
jgi:hypothetical protein